MRLTVVGCGDAFGSGGRLNTCFHLSGRTTSFLIDCGASALVGMKRCGVDPGEVDAVVVSHLHGDHFAGLAFLIRETQIAAQRSKPLTIVGPPGVERRTCDVMELLFPGSSAAQTFALHFLEYRESEPLLAGPLTIEAAAVVHTAGTAAHGVRITCDGVVVAYTGDTEWTDSIVRLSAQTDLLIAEAYTFDRHVTNHLSFETLMHERHRLGCRQLLLTHMSDEMLALSSAVPEGAALVAYDGMELELGGA
jgi:ribonuclease BN (tRNA processing enzyme)